MAALQPGEGATNFSFHGRAQSRARLLLITALALAALAQPAHATFPGKNGKIAFTSRAAQDQIETVDPDGGNRTVVPVSSARSPKWSPDGTKLAYLSGFGYPRVANPDGTQQIGLYMTGDQVTDLAWSPYGNELVQLEWYVNACPDPDTCDPPDPPFLSRPGYPSGYTRLPGNTGYGPDWSPDGSKIAFMAPGGAIQTETPDGGAVTTLASGADPSWSPDGHKLAYSEGGGNQADIVIVNADGSGLQRLAVPDGQFAPVWSPDGTKIAFVWFAQDASGSSSRSDIGVMNADGSDATRIVSDGAAYGPDWQPIPVNSYPRPRGASPLRVSLVPASKPCTSPNSFHGAPLGYGSCAPPQPTSTQLTTGTPDSNGLPVRMDASLLLRVVPGNSATTQDEADVRIDAHVNNVFNLDLSDYTGALRAAMPVRITDRDNTPSPSAPGAATTVPFQYGFDIPCTPDPAPNIGSDCSLSTTADTLVPGTIKENLRTIWQIGRVRVDDAGPDGNPDTVADNAVFAVQGIFAP
jgi:WD40-like Beta Propeller Repeat